MRYFLLSLVINLVLLLLPLKSNDIKQVEKPKIVVTLNLQEKKLTPAKKAQKPIEKLIEKPIKKPVKKIVKKLTKKVVKKVVKKKTLKKKIIKKKKKVKKKKLHKKVVKKTLKQPKLKEIIKPDMIEPKIKPQNGSKNVIKPKKSETSQPKSKKAKVFCVEGVDFVVLKKPSLKYPKRALRMRINKIVHVDVYFKVSKNEQINIIKTKGGSSIFQKEAIKRTKNMRVKLLNENAITCKIIQPFRFEP